ncbi:protein tonB [Xanthomonas translucens pv. arrhenatheri]|uniref:TonB family protein n=1 Tax=Xanthomonas graminis pv. arrhenatheri LMG 727 TaxID=1195923 RepID=A0A0K2ZCS8_9XANT|nr:energy transducer TonB [Xanthomonas translucens]OAX63572.1 protein tonB [Xanthomonas translucens pv. arrhenatheri]UKE78149.1 energy transducer TonB [Xanthomonas translucens pv. arrhenatheri]CTP83038.1 TonB family protein [Xanthomonas translucens pv. arrhenatheri LMG 727]
MHRKSGLTTWRWGGLLLALLAATAFATGSGPGAVRKQVESSLLVTGKIDIEPDGMVSALAIDHADKLPEGVLGFVRASVQRWTFEPALRDGKPVPARAPMTLRIVAKRQEGDRYQVEIRHASFAAYDPKDPRAVTSIRTPPPAYPEAAYRAGASGSAYLVLKVARDGSVADAAVEQVNLRIVASESEMQKLREIFARSALAAARKWRFRPPSEGKDVSAPYWAVRVPVNYSLRDQPNQGMNSSYGHWISYVPGPRARAPWDTGEDASGFSPDALSAGGVYMVDNNGPRLLTPLQGS